MKINKTGIKKYDVDIKNVRFHIELEKFQNDSILKKLQKKEYENKEMNCMMALILALNEEVVGLDKKLEEYENERKTT